MAIILKTPRLYLREMVSSDYFSLCKILQDEKVMYAYEHAFSDREVQNWLNRQLENYKNMGFGLWAVVLKDEGIMIGQCGLTIQDYGEKGVLEIGYLFQRLYWRQGYATEAAIACKKYAFNTLNSDEAFSIIRDKNISSQKVARKNGMKRRGELVKHYHNVEMLHYVYSVKQKRP